ncbi:MAG: HAMP domain-containing histidine kinase, partial [Anaerolineae bacterium]|nr:HAMP domain-containing histidine kinase [Anaerolineae bacterium]
NILRASLKAHAEAERARAAHEAALYDELSRLNNELAAAQRRLAKQNAELERLNALKNQFLGMAAHDLRNPLAVILSYTEFLLDDLRDGLSATHIEFLETIQSSARFMLQLVSDLLDISIIESGRLDLQMDAVDLTALVRHSVTLNQVLAERKRIKIAFQADADIPLMFVDAGKIRQVLDNLLSNALKYSHEGTTVLVTLSREAQEVLLTVTDQGQGIPPEEMHKLFQWLGKTSVRSTAGEKSSGLGLAIARRIVEGHGGRLWAESEVGKGTTFYVALPIAG